MVDDPRVDGEDLADDTFIRARPSVVAQVVHDPARWRRWWPDLSLVTVEDRGRRGLRWRVCGALTGTAEIWLEPMSGGTVLHFYLRAGLRDRDRARRTVEWKRQAFALKDELEGRCDP